MESFNDNRSTFGHQSQGAWHAPRPTKRTAPLGIDHRHLKAQRLHGFTLIELLVVISIIAVLIALLLPALAKAKAQANTVACSANMHEMGIAMAEYENTYLGFMPSNDISGFCVWIPQLMSMMNGPGSAGSFYCPAEPIESQYVATVQTTNPTMPLYNDGTLNGYGYARGQRTLGYGGWDSGGQYVCPMAFPSYGYNAWGSNYWAPVNTFEPNYPSSNGETQQSAGLGGTLPWWIANRASKVANPAQMIAVGDRMNLEELTAPNGSPMMDNSANGYPWTYDISPGAGNWSYTNTIPSSDGLFVGPESIGNVHNGGTNVLYCDGHVVWHTQYDMINIYSNRPGGSQMNMDWNIDHQFH